jgi:CubicO group peptidase (beta-lactamase class C family)
MPLLVSRRYTLKGAAAILTWKAVGQRSAVAAKSIRTTTSESMKFKSDLLSRFAKLQADGRLPNVHGVVALRRGRIVFESYMAGTDEIWGHPIGVVDFQADTLHDMRSVTKSIVGLLYGIALRERRVPAIDQSLIAQFREYPDLARDANKAKLTIRHALTMTLATDWNENLPYSNPMNSEIEMERAPDRYRFILERRMLGAPGRGYIYNGGATALLGRLIERGTGVDLHTFAKRALFEPLGIRVSEWTRGDDGVASAASGLRLTPLDLARVGQMIFVRGKWNGRTIIPSDWLDASFRPAAIVDDERRYGYQWYLGEIAYSGPTGINGAKWIGAFGLGGQRLFVIPELEFVLVVTAGNYTLDDQWKPPIAILREVFLPGLAD